MDYTTQLAHSLPADTMKALQRFQRKPRASLHTRFGSKEISSSDVRVGAETLYVIEDISFGWMSVVGKNLKVAPSFFAGHAAETSGDPWTTIMGATPSQTIQELRQIYTTHANHWHVNGVSLSSGLVSQRATCQPRSSTRDRYGLKVATRMSVWQSDQTTLILVDAPAADQYKIHIPVSNNRSGLVIPWLHGSLYDCLCQFLSHPWHINALYAHEHGAASVTPMTFCYMLAVSTWKTVLADLDAASKHIAFVEIRKPTVAINNKLHDLRRDVDSLRKEVGKTLEWFPKEVQQELDRMKKHTPKHIGTIDKDLEKLLVEADVLETFIMNSFTLLLSSISIHEAESTAKTNRRAQQLTALAFVYVPMSFVTGIFGMNITEINGSSIPASVVAVTLAVTLSSTAVAFFAVTYWQQHKKQP